MTEDDKNLKRLEISIQSRNMEIELFWKRSLFFWGFIASAFVGYAALRTQKSDLSMFLACFGMVCSCAWSLLNRGSKYWHESWETKVERFETAVTGPLFAIEEQEQTQKGIWLRARNYSVSRLAIALSDYVFIFWIAIVIAEICRQYFPNANWRLYKLGPATFAVFSFAYVVMLFFMTRRKLQRVRKR
jgi:hypothetical protein